LAIIFLLKKSELFVIAMSSYIIIVVRDKNNNLTGD